VPLNLSSSEKFILFAVQQQRTRIRNGEAKPLKTVDVHTGTTRRFAFYRIRDQNASPLVTKADEDAIDAAIRSFAAFERRRGVVLSAQEQPVQVGNFLLQKTDPKSSHSSWTHLKRGFDWND
jgi:hypothetical protein